MVQVNFIKVNIWRCGKEVHAMYGNDNNIPSELGISKTPFTSEDKILNVRINISKRIFISSEGLASEIHADCLGMVPINI